MDVEMLRSNKILRQHGAQVLRMLDQLVNAYAADKPTRPYTQYVVSKHKHLTTFGISPGDFLVCSFSFISHYFDYDISMSMQGIFDFGGGRLNCLTIFILISKFSQTIT